MTTAPAAPAATRIEVLDVIRGIAILGTFASNVWIFTDPRGPSGTLTGGGTAEVVLRSLVNGKFLALLTLMFGVGIELQHRSALRRGARWPGGYLRRPAVLFLEGLLHYLLIFEFDVLMSYAVTALVVAHLVGRSARAVRRWIAGGVAVHLLLMGLGTAALLTPQVSMRGAGSDVYARGGYPEQVALRIAEFPVYRLEAVFIIPMSIALFLIGSRLRGAGAFEDSARGRRLRRRFLAAGVVALPLNLATSLAGESWFLVDRYVLAPFVAAGLLALIIEVSMRLRGPAGPLRRGLGSVGRTALSCYVAQNLLAAIACYGWGLGLAVRLDELRPWWPVALWAVLSGALVVLSSWWLRRFRRGPIELVQHLPDQRSGR